MHRIKMTPLAGALSIAGLLSIAPVMAQTGTPVVKNVKQEIIYDGSDASMLHADPLDGGKHASLFGKDATGNTVKVNNIDATSVYRVYGGVNANSKMAQDVTGNTVNVNEGLIENDVYGGYSAKGQVKNNTVAIGSDMNNVRGEVNGGQAIQGDAIGNKVNVTGTLVNVLHGVTGASSDNGNVSKNTVTIRDSFVAGGVNGGRVFKKGDAKDNQVHITGGHVNGDVVGAASSEGSVSGNTTTIASGDQGSGYVQGSVSGGRVAKGDATGNKVDISGGRIYQDVTGASSDNGNVLKNTVTIHDSLVAGGVNGGRISKKGDVKDNLVNITGGSIHGDVVGASSDNGKVSKNVVTIRSGQIGGEVNGGHVVKGDATDNNVAILSGSHIEKNAVGGLSTEGSASNNRVTVDGGSILGDVIGGQGRKDAMGNTVTIPDRAAVTGDVIGGRAGTGLGPHNASDNTVNITSSTVKKRVYGGETTTGFSGGRSASHNTVNISGSTVQSDVYGGSNDGIRSGLSANNTINLTNSRVTGMIHGGTSDKDTGNTLNVIHHGQAQGISDIQNINFTVPADAKKGEAVLDIDGKAAVDLKHTHIKMTLDQGTDITRFHNGDVVTLVNHTTNQEDSFSAPHARQGIAIDYDFDRVKSVADQLQVKVSKFADAQTTALLEPQIASLALVNQGADRVASLSGELSQGVEGIQAFGDISGSQSRYSSANVKLNSQTLVTGVAQRATDKLGRRLLGAFVEYGTGSYDSHNAISDHHDDHHVDGSGKTHYIGAGLFARYDLSNGVYVDSALRAGSAKLDFNGDNFHEGKENRPVSLSESLSSTYYGAQLGVGWMYVLSSSTSLDFSSRLLWSRVNGSTQNILDQAYHFNALDSQRWYNGVRLNYAFNPNLKTYGGLAYEQEFSGKAGGSVDDLNLASSTIKGGTTIAEWGIHWSQTKDNGQGFNVDAGLQGYTGKRKGFGEQLHVSYVF